MAAAFPVETMPDGVPARTIELPIGDDAGLTFTDDEAANLARITMLRNVAELKGMDAGS